MDFLKSILENSQYSFVTAFMLGLMTAISPCPLATNISAIGFISRDIEDRKRVFKNGLVYTLGRAISYSTLALILFFGASQMHISRVFQGWGEKLLAPLLIVIGLFMLDIFQIRFPGFARLTERIQNNGRGRYWNSLLLGIVYAMAFCPYSGVLFFAILMPMTLASAGGLYLPAVFAVATGLPVILFAWLIAYAIGNVGKFYNSIKSFELWFRRVSAILFIITGLYYSVLLFL
jgi:cytochrome c-type biogenesis protein